MTLRGRGFSRLILIVVLVTAATSAYLTYMGFRTLAGGASGSSSANSSTQEGSTIHRLQRGQLSGYAQSANLVIDNNDQFESMWDQAFCRTIVPCPRPPAVNFQGRTVLAIFLGQRGSTGYSVDITSVTSSNSNINVNVLVKVPGHGCTEGQALTNPYDIIDVPKVHGVASFVAETETYDC